MDDSLAPQDDLSSLRLEELRSRIDVGLASLGWGERVDGESFMKEMLDDLDRREVNRDEG